MLDTFDYYLKSIISEDLNKKWVFNLRKINIHFLLAILHNQQKQWLEGREI